ncbi:MAG TPA: preprotein translocase subunit SecE [Ktedonobacterales bacterium]
MAKTINQEDNSAANATDVDAESADVDETELVNEAEPDDAYDDVEEFADDEEPAAEPEQRAVAPLDDERVVARPGGTGVYVPDFLLKSPLTRGLTEAYIELRKVTWPTRQDAWNMTIVTIVVSAIMAALLAASDWGLGHALTYLVNLGLGK